ncbi:hypothetical protein HMPREF0322_00430 [Desulfitobacterium hafniense DP7]|uniref:Uncharacterized protein n=1 Tax=Desulfitobacterium hafniense DP7 TaxID=537010 RepID=G9XHK5_DESHA|nr:hypothetical protein [Desulfitobacterium hafniense]EHL08788.1 hypothetical protein HMPREF0322_00430 [Desulfitobacterium hafniense DP7]
MQETVRRSLLNSTVTDIEDLEGSTTFYLKGEDGRKYAVEVKSGETVTRVLNKVAYEVFSAEDLSTLAGFTVKEIGGDDRPEVLIFTGPNGEEAFLIMLPSGSLLYYNDLDEAE